MECSSCGALYNKSCGCSKGGLVDKFVRDPNKTPDSSQRPPIVCVKCGNPVEGPSCQGCALWRKKLKEVWFTTCHENGINQDLLNTSESSDDDTNVVNAPREPFVVKQDPGENSSQSPPQINHNCCYECGDSLDGIFCQQCTCKSCGKGAHIGYNCPPKAPIISNPEPCNQTIDELPQTLPSFDPKCYSEKENSLPYVSKPNFVDDSPNVFNPPPQPPIYSCEFCGNNACYGHYCTPQVPFIYPEPCYNQDFNFPQDFHDFQQQYLCCENCGGPHEAFQCQPLNYYEPNPCYDSNYSGYDQFDNSHPQQFLCCENCGGPHEIYQCQPMNEDYYHEQNSCYDPNSFGFDQFQPPQYTVNHPIFDSQNELLNSQNEFLNTQNELLNSSNKLMEQMTTLCDMVGQAIQKKEEEKRIAEEQAAEDRYWKIPICYDDDDDYTIAITPKKSSVENLVPIPSESEGIPDSVCDVPLCNNPTSLEAFKEHSETIIDSNDDSTSSDDDSYENIDYVDASPPDAEIVSLEVVEIVIPEVGGIDTDILLTIKDDILREKLLNVNLLIANIEALKDNPAPSSCMTKSSSTSLNLFLEETNTFDNSSPEAKTFCFDLEENSSGSPTTQSDYSLPDYEAFYDSHIKEKSSGSTTTHADFSQYDSFIFDLSINPFPPADRSVFNMRSSPMTRSHIISIEYEHFCLRLSPTGNLNNGCGGKIFPNKRTKSSLPNVLSTHPQKNPLDTDFHTFN
ncbi:hypothetical protein Tco_0281868 [Tanacetum coccineum]